MCETKAGSIAAFKSMPPLKGQHIIEDKINQLTASVRNSCSYIEVLVVMQLKTEKDKDGH